MLAGREGYEVAGGSVTYLGRDLLAMEAEERAREGCSSPSSTRSRSRA